MSPITLSGALGLVIVPDMATIECCYSLAAEIMPTGSQYMLRPGSLPHLTLYHGKLEGVPRKEVQLLLNCLQSNLIGRTFFLGDLVTFGGNFIFWNVDRSSAEFELLADAHAASLDLAKYLAKSAAAKAVSDEALRLTEAELENVRLFGHPLVRDLFTPHITLGFNPNLSQKLPLNMRHEWSFQVASVEIAKIGHPGRVEEVIHLEKTV